MFGIPELPASSEFIVAAFFIGIMVGVCAIVLWTQYMYIPHPKHKAHGLRETEWVFIGVLLVALVGVFAPTQLPLLITKEAMVVVSGVLGLFFDRRLVAPYARPDNPALPSQLQAAASQRRAIIIAGFVIAGALGA